MIGDEHKTMKIDRMNCCATRGGLLQLGVRWVEDLEFNPEISKLGSIVALCETGGGFVVCA